MPFARNPPLFLWKTHKEQRRREGGLLTRIEGWDILGRGKAPRKRGGEYGTAGAGKGAAGILSDRADP